MKKFEIKNHEPSYLPEGSKWSLAWSDEFDGTDLDRTKWSFRLNYWGRRFEGYTDRGVIVRNGCVELHRTEVDGRYVSPQLQTGANSFDYLIEERENPWGQKGIWPLGELEPPKFVHRYGYYECRCKFQKDPETMWSAFWTQSPTIGARFEPEWCGIESDIMEYFHEGRAHTTNLMGGYGKQFKRGGKVKYNLEDTEGGWHYFGMDWREDGYTFYCDGKEVMQCNDHVSHVPQFIMLTTEVQGYRSGLNGDENGQYRLLGGKGPVDEPPFRIKGEFVDDCFIVDHVRVFDRIDP